MSLIRVLSTSARELSCYKVRESDTFFIAQIDDCAKMLKETNLDFNVANY